MGWKAFFKDGSVKDEATDGRPVQEGEDGLLQLIVQEDFGHRVAVDLINGAIVIDCDEVTVQNQQVEIANPRAVIYICDETNLVADLYDIQNSDIDEEGWYSQSIVPITWRPIWFTRITNGIPTKVIGAQTTLPEVFGGKNVKKLVSIFADGRIGID